MDAESCSIQLSRVHICRWTTGKNVDLCCSTFCCSMHFSGGTLRPQTNAPSSSPSPLLGRLLSPLVRATETERKRDVFVTHQTSRKNAFTHIWFEWQPGRKIFVWLQLTCIIYLHLNVRTFNVFTHMVRCKQIEAPAAMDALSFCSMHWLRRYNFRDPTLKKKLAS